MMLRHIIMYKFLPEAGGQTKAENLRHAQDLAKAMILEIPQLRSCEIGIGSNRQKDTNYDIVLVCDMDDFNALAEYKAAPAHKAYGDFCHSVAEFRAAIDYEF